MAEVVRQVKQEPRCKLCITPHRGEIDALLLLRSKRSVDEKGVRVDEPYIKRRGTELGIANLNHENLTVHWRNHCQVVLEEDEEEIDELIQSVMGQVTPEDLKEMTAADRLELLEMQGFVELQARLKKTGKTGITIDQLIRINELKQRQKSNEDQRRFLGALGTGLERALGAALRPALPEGRTEHPVIEIQEAEVVSVAEEADRPEG